MDFDNVLNKKEYESNAHARPLLGEGHADPREETPGWLRVPKESMDSLKDARIQEKEQVDSVAFSRLVAILRHLLSGFQ